VSFEPTIHFRVVFPQLSVLAGWYSLASYRTGTVHGFSSLLVPGKKGTITTLFFILRSSLPA
jgi:hypothetical protein